MTADLGREPYESPAYWCPRCSTPHYVGEPEDRCTDCGYERTAS